MTETAWVKPAQGLKVRFEQPASGHIPEEGADVPLTRYYRRRLRDGDLVKTRRPAAPKAEKKEAK